MLLLICVLFLAFRLPLMYRQPGGMDEGDFAVPGYTILQDGIPRIPYVPSRNTEGCTLPSTTAGADRSGTRLLGPR